MNEKSGAELAAEEIHQHYFERLRWDTGRDKEQVAAIITKHFPSGDVGQLREALEKVELPAEASMNEYEFGPKHCTNPPQVDTTLTVDEAKHRLAVYAWNIDGFDSLSKETQQQITDCAEWCVREIKAHARKSQPKENDEGVLACPWCGGFPAVTIGRRDVFGHRICACLNPTCPIVGLEINVPAWNRRAAESAAVPSMEDECSRREFVSSTKQLLDYNGGPIDGDDGIEYVMVRRIDFSALEKLYSDSQAARKEGGK